MTTKKAPKKTVRKRNSTKAIAPEPAAQPEAAPVGKVSALDAAVKVLGASAEPLTTKQLIEAMAAQGLWTSPGGKTPAATLYSAILREIGSKGDDARFKKAERGKFTLA